MKKEVKEKKKFGKIISIILSVILIISFGYLSYRILEANILPTKYFIGIEIALIILILIVILLSFRPRKNVLNWIFRSLAVIISAIFIFISTYFTSFTNFISNIIDNTAVVQYHLVVKIANSDYIKDYENKKIGVHEIDEDESLKFLASINLKNFTKYSGTINDIAEKVLDESIAAMVLNDTTLETLKEEDSEFDFANQFKIIKSYQSTVKDNPNANYIKTNVTSEPFIIYISGLDTSGKITNRSRSDVNILAIVNPNTNKILLVHIPRDAYMKLAGTSGNLKDKLTHAGVYGINTSVQTIENYFNIDINYYVKINFTTLVNAVDLLGGIDVYNEYAFDGFKQGNIHLTGSQALWYSRIRKTLSTGDVGRGKHQQDVIAGLINKASLPTNLIKANSLLKTLNNSFDTNMSSNDISKLIKLQLDEMPNWTVESYSISGQGLNEYTYTYPRRKLYVMALDQVQVDTAKSLINNYLK